MNQKLNPKENEDNQVFTKVFEASSSFFSAFRYWQYGSDILKSGEFLSGFH